MNKEYSIIIGGAAGQGSRKAGFLIAKIFSQLGYYIYIYEDYQSLIKGGHNFSQIIASEKKNPALKSELNFLLALDQNTIDRHQKKLKKDGLLFFNSNKISAEGIGIPADEILKECDGLPIMANTALIAGMAKGLGIDWELLRRVLEQELPKEKDKNLIIAERAYNQAKQIFVVEKTGSSVCDLMTGNEAIVQGLVKAGLEIYFAYPMTPASSILHYLASHQKDWGVLAVQPESEIAVASEALGAAYAGKRTAVGTSGGGFSLMVESLSMAAQAELPFLVINSQRMGPATGVPTYGAQSDLLFTLYAGHGDFKRFVAAPSNAEESFYWAGTLLNLAWKYQTPAILLTDKDVSEGTFSIESEFFEQIKKQEALLWNQKGEYQRYKINNKGISPLAFPGQANAIIKSNSYEHNEFGITEEVDKDMIEAMQNKRLIKYKAMEEEAEELPALKIFGNQNSKIAVVAWGSTVLTACEAVENLGLKLIQPILISPFPKKQMQTALRGVEKIICVETNALGQMAMLLEEQGFPVFQKILKYKAELFSVEELKEELQKII
jgi:2-oxoglutarate ferredoxin oxidoreductase subunit alpha